MVGSADEFFQNGQQGDLENVPYFDHSAYLGLSHDFESNPIVEPGKTFDDNKVDFFGSMFDSIIDNADGPAIRDQNLIDDGRYPIHQDPEEYAQEWEVSNYDNRAGPHPYSASKPHEQSVATLTYAPPDGGKAYNGQRPPAPNRNAALQDPPTAVDARPKIRAAELAVLTCTALFQPVPAAYAAAPQTVERPQRGWPAPLPPPPPRFAPASKAQPAQPAHPSPRPRSEPSMPSPAGGGSPARRTDAGAGEMLQRRRAEPARPDREHPRALQPVLAGTADAAQHDVAGVAFNFFGGEFHAPFMPFSPSS